MSTQEPSPEEIKQRTSGLFNIIAHGYDNPSSRFFQFCADKLLDILQPEPNTYLLDIATGTGAVATSAAKKILPGGRVHGIDLSAEMLDVAHKNAQKMSLTNIDLYEMDAEQPDFKSDYFHYITCSFGIFFLPDMDTALKHWLRVLQPGGKMIMSTFGATAFTPQADLFYQRLAEYDIEVAEPRWLHLSTHQHCHALLDKAGYTDIQTETKQMGYHLTNVEDWWEILWNTGTRGFLNRLSAEQLAEFRKDHLQEVQALVSDSGIWLNIETIFSTATKPEK